MSAAIARWALLALGCAAACREEQPARRAGTPAATARTTRVATAGGEVVATPPDAPIVRNWLSDENVVSLARLLNTKQFAAARVELDRWHTDSVATFAEQMAREHVAMQRALDSLATALKLVPISPALAESVGAAAQAQINALAGLRSSALESGFLEQQVTSHEGMIDFTRQLAAAADRPELNALLMAHASRLQVHLSAAKALRRAVALSDSTRIADSTSTADSTRKAKAARDSARQARAEKRRKSTP